MHLHRALTSAAATNRREGAPRRPFCRFRVALAVALAAASLTGCLVADPGPLSRWEPAASAPPEQHSDNLPYGPLPAQRFDLYPRVAGRHDDGRTIIFFHGGAWREGDRSAVPALLLDLTRSGWNVISASYRLTCADRANPACTGARFPDQIADVKLAIRAVKARAADLDVDPERIVVAGYSAGGHLATIAALSPGELEPPEAGLDAGVREVSSEVRGYVNFNGPTDMGSVMTSDDRVGDVFLAPSAALLFPSCVVQRDQTARCDDREVAAATARTWLDPSDPPGYVLTGGLDTLVPSATQAVPYEALAAAITGDAGRVWLDIAEQGGHDYRPVNVRALRQWLDRAVQ